MTAANDFTEEPPAAVNDRKLDIERLEVYRIALDFHALANALPLGQGGRELRDQLRRASISIPLNIAEAVGMLTRWCQRLESTSVPPDH